MTSSSMPAPTSGETGLDPAPNRIAARPTRQSVTANTAMRIRPTEMPDSGRRARCRRPRRPGGRSWSTASRRTRAGTARAARRPPGNRHLTDPAVAEPGERSKPGLSDSCTLIPSVRQLGSRPVDGRVPRYDEEGQPGLAMRDAVDRASTPPATDRGDQREPGRQPRHEAAGGDHRQQRQHRADRRSIMPVVSSSVATTASRSVMARPRERCSVQIGQDRSCVEPSTTTMATRDDAHHRSRRRVRTAAAHRLRRPSGAPRRGRGVFPVSGPGGVGHRATHLNAAQRCSAGSHSPALAASPAL